MRRECDVSAIPHALFVLLSVCLVATRFGVRGQPRTVVVVETLLPLSLAVGIAYAGYRFSMLEPTHRQVLFAGGILCGGCLYGASFVALIEWVQSLGGSTPVDARYMVLVAGVGGVAMATVIAHYYVGYANRIADATAASNRANQLQRQASILNRTLRHNIRNELTITRGWLDIAFDAEDPRDAARGREIVYERLDNLESASETARQIQKLAREECVPTDVVADVETVVAEFRHAWPDVTVTTTLPAARGALIRARVDVALREALANAVEHNDPETLTVAVSVTLDEDAPDAEGRWCVEISDDGTGIPPIEVDALSGTQSDPLRHGQGLGLYLIQTVVERAGGSLEIDENVPTGTTVRFLLPRGDTQAELGSRE